MNNVGTAFLLTTIAGLSTMLGVLVIFFKAKIYQKIIAGSLSFAAGVMICVSITDLIPESVKLLRDNYNFLVTVLLCMIFIILGIIISVSIDKYIPINNNVKNKSLFKVGIFYMFAIILHNIQEGIATFIATTSDISLGVSLVIAIALHNIPEGISISVPIYYATNSKFKAVFYTFISGMSELFGALITFLFLKNFINDTFMGLLFALIAGIMLQISFWELLPTSKNYGLNKITKIGFICGFIFMLFRFL